MSENPLDEQYLELDIIAESVIPRKGIAISWNIDNYAFILFNFFGLE